MSVPQGKRTPSKMEFVKVAFKLQGELLLWMSRDFGLKSRIRTPEDFCHYYNIQAEDQELLMQIFQRNNVLTIKDVYDPDIVDYFKTEIRNSLMKMIKNIDLANEIYVSTETDYVTRRKYQIKAISYCKHIEHVLASMKYMLKFVIKSHILEYIRDIDKLLSLLRGWKNKDYNRFKKMISDESNAKIIEQEENVHINNESSMVLLDLVEEPIMQEQNLVDDFSI